MDAMTKEELGLQSLTMPCYGLFTPRNREERRAMSIEYGKIMEKLAPIEEQFYMSIFSDEGYWGYEKFLEMYEKTAVMVFNLYRPKYCKINDYFFQQNFAPLEKESEPYKFKNEWLWKHYSTV